MVRASRLFLNSLLIRSNGGRMHDVQIARADLADLEALAPLFDAYRQFYRLPGDVDAAAAFLHARLTQQQSVVFLAHLGQSAIGFCQLYPTFSSLSLGTTYILNDLYVDPVARGMGAGTALLAAAIEHARAEQAHGLSLQTAIDNYSAQRLYQSTGWQREQEFWAYNFALHD